MPPEAGRPGPPPGVGRPGPPPRAGGPSPVDEDTVSTPLVGTRPPDVLSSTDRGRGPVPTSPPGHGPGPTAPLPDGPPPGSARSTAAAIAAAVAAVATLALWFTAGGTVAVYAATVLLVQAALVAAWCVAARPPAPAGVAAVGLLTAVGVDAVGLWSDRTTAAPLVGVVAGAFGLVIVAQLVRGVTRRNVTEAFGASLTVALAVTALATTVPLLRQDGRALLSAFLLASGTGVVVARLGDLVAPRPVVHEAVPRGLLGLGLGGFAGAGVAALSAAVSDPLSIPLAAAVGWVVATAAVLADLGVGYARAGRLLTGHDDRRPALDAALSAVLGPLLGLAVAAPVGYVFGLVLLT